MAESLMVISSLAVLAGYCHRYCHIGHHRFGRPMEYRLYYHRHLVVVVLSFVLFLCFVVSFSKSQLGKF